jgi:hypothetical protein
MEQMSRNQQKSVARRALAQCAEIRRAGVPGSKKPRIISGKEILPYRGACDFDGQPRFMVVCGPSVANPMLIPERIPLNFLPSRTSTGPGSALVARPLRAHNPSP